MQGVYMRLTRNCYNCVRHLFDAAERQNMLMCPHVESVPSCVYFEQPQMTCLVAVGWHRWSSQKRSRHWNSWWSPWASKRSRTIPWNLVSWPFTSESSSNTRKNIMQILGTKTGKVWLYIRCFRNWVESMNCP